MDIVSFGLTMLLGALIGSFLTVIALEPYNKGNSEIVKHSCAHYDATTGKFTWNQGGNDRPDTT